MCRLFEEYIDVISPLTSSLATWIFVFCFFLPCFYCLPIFFNIVRGVLDIFIDFDSDILPLFIFAAGLMMFYTKVIAWIVDKIGLYCLNTDFRGHKKIFQLAYRREYVVNKIQAFNNLMTLATCLELFGFIAGSMYLSVCMYNPREYSIRELAAYFRYSVFFSPYARSQSLAFDLKTLV